MPPSEGAATPTDGHQPPTTFHLGVATARVTSLPLVTTAIGTPLHDETEPLTTTGSAALTGLRLLRTLAAGEDERTGPPRYSGLITAARAAGMPVAVKVGGGTTAVVGATVVADGATVTFLGVDEHPLSAKAPTRNAVVPTAAAGRDKDSKKGAMPPPYVLPVWRPRIDLNRGRASECTHRATATDT